MAAARAVHTLSPAPALYRNILQWTSGGHGHLPPGQEIPSLQRLPRGITFNSPLSGVSVTLGPRLGLVAALVQAMATPTV